jgi:hypothetical protein
MYKDAALLFIGLVLFLARMECDRPFVPLFYTGLVVFISECFQVGTTSKQLKKMYEPTPLIQTSLYDPLQESTV